MNNKIMQSRTALSGLLSRLEVNLSLVDSILKQRENYRHDVEARILKSRRLALLKEAQNFFNAAYLNSKELELDEKQTEYCKEFAEIFKGEDIIETFDLDTNEKIRSVANEIVRGKMMTQLELKNEFERMLDSMDPNKTDSERTIYIAEILAELYDQLLDISSNLSYSSDSLKKQFLDTTQSFFGLVQEYGKDLGMDEEFYLDCSDWSNPYSLISVASFSPHNHSAILLLAEKVNRVLQLM